MRVNSRVITLFLTLMILCSVCQSLSAEDEIIEQPVAVLAPPTINKDQIKPYLLPEKHPLHDVLRPLFQHDDMFRSVEEFKKAGFKVKRGHRRLMVGAHPKLPPYLFKKFMDSLSPLKQLTNYIKRIEGANILLNYIKEHKFKHLIVPKKWLYKLPRRFSKEDQTTHSYILIVENMDIYDDWDDPNGEARKLYYHMSTDMLTELCTVLHAVGGCDAYPRNQPFTRSGKIAFVDTEHVGGMKDHFIKHIVPALNPELQAYAVALWVQLEEEQQAKIQAEDQQLH